MLFPLLAFGTGYGIIGLIVIIILIVILVHLL